MQYVEREVELGVQEEDTLKVIHPRARRGTEVHLSGLQPPA